MNNKQLVLYSLGHRRRSAAIKPATSTLRCFHLCDSATGTPGVRSATCIGAHRTTPSADGQRRGQDHPLLIEVESSVVTKPRG